MNDFSNVTIIECFLTCHRFDKGKDFRVFHQFPIPKTYSTKIIPSLKRYEDKVYHFTMVAYLNITIPIYVQLENKFLLINSLAALNPKIYVFFFFFFFFFFFCCCCFLNAVKVSTVYLSETTVRQCFTYLLCSKITATRITIITTTATPVPTPTPIATVLVSPEADNLDAAKCRFIMF